MAIFRLEIPDEHVEEIFAAVCSNYNYKELVSNPDYQDGGDEPETITNPQTKGQFTHEIVRKFLVENVKSFKVSQARKSAVDAVDVNISLSDPDA